MNSKTLMMGDTRLDNRLSTMGLRGLGVIEQNLWWAIAKLIKDRGTDKLIFSRAEIENISGYRGLKQSKNFFVKDMKAMGRKIVALNTEIYDKENDTWIMFALFPTYKVNSKEIEIQVSEYFAPWFNDIQNNFTRIDLSVLIALKSSYSKELYRFLMRWKELKLGNKYPGFWSVKIDEFRRLMCIPESYTMTDIKRIVLNTAEKELTSTDDNGWSPLEYLDIKLVPVIGLKKKIDRIEFTFKQMKPIASKVIESKVSLNTPVFIPEVAYENNFKNDYIPGKNSPTKVFKAWVAEVNLFKDNDEYFEMRSKSKTDLMSIYKSKVIDADNKYWTDMRFFAAAYSVIINDKAMTSWNIEDAYSEIRKGKRLDIPQEIYSSLPDDKGKQLQAFALKGEIA